MKKKKKMKEIRDQVINLKESPLYEYRTENNYYPVIGEGSHDADIMFIGEAPGRNEARTGRPFCGSAGRILNELLDHIKVERKDVYIANILKDRPPENRDPLPEEIAVYAPYLDRQIEIIEPKVIATLGRFSMEYVMKRYGLEGDLGPISKLHGRVFESKSLWHRLKIAILYHPAVAIYNSNMKDELKTDFEILKEFV